MSQSLVVVPGAMLLIRTLARIPDLQCGGLLTAGHVRPVVSTRPYISCMLSQTGYLLYVIIIYLFQFSNQYNGFQRTEVYVTNATLLARKGLQKNPLGLPLREKATI